MTAQGDGVSPRPWFDLGMGFRWLLLGHVFAGMFWLGKCKMWCFCHLASNYSGLLDVVLFTCILWKGRG